MLPSRKIILETERLRLDEFEIGDAPFVLRLLNSPGWLEFIGDRNIHSLIDAMNYIRQHLQSHYQRHGFGFWRVCVKNSGDVVGMCGLAKRDYLDHVDIGYALLPNYFNQGYASEAASAVLNYATTQLKLPRLLAITVPANRASSKLLQKLGMQFDGIRQHPDGADLACFSTA